jgi:hypothetical protein
LDKQSSADGPHRVPCIEDIHKTPMQVGPGGKFITTLLVLQAQRHSLAPRAKENVVATGPASGSHSPPHPFRNQQALLKNLINEWASTTSMTKIGHSII